MTVISTTVKNGLRKNNANSANAATIKGLSIFIFFVYKIRSVIGKRSR